MEKMMERLGIYDLIVILLTGICITVFSSFLNEVLFNFLVPKYLEDLGALKFFAISYFVGMLFQEVSSFLQQRVFFRDHKLLKQAMRSPVKSCSKLEDQEIASIKKIVQRRLGLKETPNDRMTYDYCRHALLMDIRFCKADNDQITAGVSRSLALYFALLGVPIAGKLLHMIACQDIASLPVNCLWLIGSWGIACLLYYRFKRFSQMRYIYILRAFYNTNPQRKCRKIVSR